MDNECRLTRLKVFFIGQILRTLGIDWDCSPLSSDWTEDNSDRFGAGVNKAETDEVMIVLQQIGQHKRSPVKVYFQNNLHRYTVVLKKAMLKNEE